MSRETHKRFIERGALREAQKAVDRHGRDSFRRETFAQLRVQTIEPWKRVSFASLGFLIVGAGVYTLQEDIPWLALLFFMLGAFCVLASILGRKKSVEAALNGIDLTYLFEALF